MNLIPFFVFFSTPPVSYETSLITYVWKNDEDTLRKSPSLTTLNAYLIHNKTDDCDVKGTWRGMAYTSVITWRNTWKMLIALRELFMSEGWVDVYKGSCILLHNRFHTRNYSCNVIIYYILARVECRSC